MNYLLLGASGKLGTELQKLRNYTFAPTHDELDVTNPESIANYQHGKQIDLVIHCAAYTDVVKAEQEYVLCRQINTESVRYLKGIIPAPLLYISSEYAADPQGTYAKTKLEGEKLADKSLRLLFKPTPFPYEEAFYDQWTNGDYVDVIAKEVDKAIDLYEYLPQVLQIGTQRKTIYHLALQTKNIVIPVSRTTITDRYIPEDTSVDISEWERIKNEHSSSTSYSG